MKTAFVLSLAGLAAAQSISTLVGEIPSCAQAPLLKAIGTTSCATTDYACQCSSANQSKIAAAATPAIEAACSAADIQTVLQISQEICALALAATSSAAPATSAAATSAAATSAAATSAAASSAAATSAAATSAAASSAAPVSQISDGQPQVTAPAPAVSQISDGQVQATAPVPPVYTGAAVKAGPVAGAVILAAAAFAL